MPSIPRVVNRRILYASPKTVTDAWRLRAEVDAPHHNGLGRYVCQLKRLSIFFDRVWENSAGVREFIKEDLVDFAKENPGVALYVIPKRQKAPYMVGEYLNGRDANVHMSHFSRSEVNRWVEYFRTRSGQRIAAFERDWRTETPSIQGPWDPFINIPTTMNTDELPKKLPFQSAELSATELVQKLMRENQEPEIKE